MGGPWWGSLTLYVLPGRSIDDDVIVVGATRENLLLTDDRLGLNQEDETSTERLPKIRRISVIGQTSAKDSCLYSSF